MSLESSLDIQNFSAVLNEEVITRLKKGLISVKPYLMMIPQPIL
jgi:hypothetical protein